MYKVQVPAANRADLVRPFNPEVNPSPGNTGGWHSTRSSRRSLHDMIDSNFDLYRQIVEDSKVGELFKEFMFEKVEKSLRRRTDNRT
jgi:hypothetical protein